MMVAMPSTAATDETIAALTAHVAALSARCDTVLGENAQLRAQVAWFQRQLFGRKSERRIVQPDAAQGTLGEAFDAVPDAPAPGRKTRIAGHERSATPRRADVDESTLFFDEGKVPVEVIPVANPEAKGLDPEDYEVIGERVSHRLAQRPGSYVVLRYVRPVIKRRDTQALSCPAAPVGVIEGSRADVSFIAGLLIDKLVYHLPLYRQHQRLAQCGIRVSRQWLTQIAQAAIALIEPIHDAQWQSILSSRVKRMDETPVKAGRDGPGKMKSAYFWPVMGEREEICFHYQPSWRQEHVEQLLGQTAATGSVLHTDGYKANAWYAKKTGLAHAQCWAHSRRAFVKAEEIEPARVAEALEHIGALYRVEEDIRQKGLTGSGKRAWRQQYAKPAAQQFFVWVDRQFESQGLLPSSPLTKALAYVRERREGLLLYLDDPDVEIDTNSLERALRAIPMGKKNWMFCWTELGARQIGIAQSLLVTCKLHDIDPYDYLVDVLQRVGQHPASRVHELTPRMWKSLFAGNPLRSPLHQDV
ncbi:transposase [Paraburkholderia sp. BL17N1]|nr:transposase [Paraburkholderia sp. BL17N1]